MIRLRSFSVLVTGLVLSATMARGAEGDGSPLPGTERLVLEGDIASHLVDGVDRFLLDQLEESVAKRARHWNRDFSSAEAYRAAIEPNRKRLAYILGVRDERVPFEGLELVGSTSQPPLVGKGAAFQAFAVRWPAFGDVFGEGLLLVPTGQNRIADVIAIPDADQTPEMIAGLADGVPAESQFARRLAESGCRVLVPVLINRSERVSGISQREFLYRSAFELGRHPIGYEIQKVLAGVDFFTQEADAAAGAEAGIGVIGWGEGGLLALGAAALDERIDAVATSGYFDCRENVWREPISRNVFGLLEQFGDAELASMIAPRPLVVEAARGPELVHPPGTRGAPGRLVSPKLDDVKREVARANGLVSRFATTTAVKLVVSGSDGTGPFGSSEALAAFLEAVSPGGKLASAGESPVLMREGFDPGARHARAVWEIERHNSRLLDESAYVRKEFLPAMEERNQKPIALDDYGEMIEPYREKFYNEVIGRFDIEPLAPNVRSRKSYDEPKWTGHEVVMDLFPDVIAYGILLLPKDLKPGEKRPVVVCQHGLEGRPQDVVRGEGRTKAAYKDFAAELAERGFITFAPQNLYLFRDRFRTLQRKANPIGKSLFSVIVPQHQQILDWLKTLPQVDPDRIAFYGLSYGGKTAMRVPPLVTDYCLSICSADFNEWVWKNAATNTRRRYSYVWTGEYEIFEFDLGSTFNYAEMASLIAPRPFMVERGHFDGVGSDESVAYEFAKVRHLYAARLGLADRCEIEWFVGPHSIHGVGTYNFLHKHLKWPKPAGSSF